MLDAETEEPVSEVPICMVTEDEIGKPTMVITGRLLLVPELKEIPIGEADILDIQGTDNFEHRMILTESEKVVEEDVTEDIGSTLEKYSGIEEVECASDG